MAHGTEVVGLPLYIKTARKCVLMGDNSYWQEVVFMDCSGEMTGYILYAPPEESSEYNQRRKTASPLGSWKSNDRIVVIKGSVQECDERRKESNKLMVEECCSTTPNLTFDQRQQLSAEEWKVLKRDETLSKIKCWYISSAIQSNQIQLMQPTHFNQVLAAIDILARHTLGE